MNRKMRDSVENLVKQLSDFNYLVSEESNGLPCLLSLAMDRVQSSILPLQLYILMDLHIFQLAGVSRGVSSCQQKRLL